MSNNEKAIKKSKKRPEIPSVVATPHDLASTRRTLDRIRGRVPMEETTGPVDSTGPVITAPPESTGPPKSTKPALPFSGPVESTGPVNSIAPPQVLNLMASLPDVAGFTRFWHQIVDHLYRQLTPSEQCVHVQLYRLSWGHNKPTCEIGIPKLAERTGLSEKTARVAVTGLLKKGLVRKERLIFGAGVEQGIEYYVIPPSALVKSTGAVKSTGPEKSTAYKEESFKRKDIKEVSPKITRLTPEDKQETIEMIADLITKNGYTFEQAENQFGGNLTPDDWTAIRARVGVQGTQPSV